MRHKEFVDVLLNKKVIRHNIKRIQSKLYRIGTYDVCKVSLSCFDEKRDILDDGINSLAYILFCFNKIVKNFIELIPHSYKVDKSFIILIRAWSNFIRLIRACFFFIKSIRLTKFF